MSLKIEHLTKIYGSQRAVDDVSFNIGQGEIVGFLGPNGAGKSTTMKIATGYLPPTFGSIEVNGLNVVAQPKEVKKIIGYLPEHNPLYLDMYVHEYLHFIGRVYQLPASRLIHRVKEIISICGLEPEQNKLIGSLSKGYRQRVGLAQALIHDPSVLILDEPTTGLDPNQIVEIRKLIKEISRDKTVIFSTHIMQEVQAICNRVIIINHGKIVADDNLETLTQLQAKTLVISVEFKESISSEVLAVLPNVEKIVGSDRFFQIHSSADIRPELIRLATEKNLSLLSLKQSENSMEEIFRSLTSETSS
jgi:ABC-2 type transport system ATP-binding protein